jgi:catechol 2,3-dioxygenase-like lactoylglutathione lyase family enzyme
VEIGFITIDCADSERLMAFWSDALGYEVNRGVYTTLRDPGATGVALYFQQVPEPRGGKNRLHLDLVSGSVDRDLSRLVERGATHVTDVEENGLRWSVLEDPEGNVFCLFPA